METSSPAEVSLPGNLFHLRQLVRSLWQVRSEPLFQRLWPIVRRAALRVGVLYALYQIGCSLLFFHGATLTTIKWKNAADPALLIASILIPASLLTLSVKWLMERIGSDAQIRLLPLAAEVRLRILISLVVAALLTIEVIGFLGVSALDALLFLYGMSQRPAALWAQIVLVAAYFFREAVPFLLLLPAFIVVGAFGAAAMTGQHHQSQGSLMKLAVVALLVVTGLALLLEAKLKFLGIVLWEALSTGILDIGFSGLWDRVLTMLLISMPLIVLNGIMSCVVLVAANALWSRALSRARGAFTAEGHA